MPPPVILALRGDELRVKGGAPGLTSCARCRPFVAASAALRPVRPQVCARAAAEPRVSAVLVGQRRALHKRPRTRSNAPRTRSSSANRPRCGNACWNVILRTSSFRADRRGSGGSTRGGGVRASLLRTGFWSFDNRELICVDVDEDAGAADGGSTALEEGAAGVGGGGSEVESVCHESLALSCSRRALTPAGSCEGGERGLRAVEGIIVARLYS